MTTDGRREPSLHGLSGLDAMRAMADGTLPPPAIATLMRLSLVLVDDGRVVFAGMPGTEHYNPLGIVHGGFAMTIMDSAMGCAIHTKLAAGVGYASTDVSVRFVRAITSDTGEVRCEGRVLHVGRTIALAEGTLVDASGKLLATGTTACAILRP